MVDVHYHTASLEIWSASSALTLKPVQTTLVSIYNAGLTIGNAAGDDTLTLKDSSNNIVCEMADAAVLTLQSTELLVNGSVTCASAARLKQNISTLRRGLSDVLQVRGVQWQWSSQPDNSRPAFGVVAQELQAMAPDMACADASGVLAVDYNGVLAMLLQSVKDLDAKIERGVGARSCRCFEITATSHPQCD